MTRKTRRFIFYSLVAIFILVTPPTILYAVGYSYDWQKQTLVRNGGIYLKSTPAGAQITINNQDYGTTARLISHLVPSVYKIVISADGFYSWEKKLEVTSGIITEERNIFLFPKEIKAQLSSENATSSIQNFLSTGEEKENKILAQQTASTTAGWAVNKDLIYYVSSDNFLIYREDLNGKNIQQISNEPLPENRYEIITNDGAIILILSKDGILYYLNRTNSLPETIDSGIKNAALSDDNKKILFWTENEIWVYYLNDILTQPYKKTGDKELITRYGQQISQAIFYPDNEHITFVVGDQIKITELDDRDVLNIIDFISATQPQIYFDRQNNYFYYLTENKLFRLTLNR